MQDLTVHCMQKALLKRPIDAHKGLFGRVLVVGGDHGMLGAVRIAAEGALRVGAGIVTVVTREAHVVAVMSGRPELLCYGLESSGHLLDELRATSSVVVLGPGLGESAWSRDLFDVVSDELFESLPILIDADGLNWLARTHKPGFNRSNWVLTPHPGEAARLLKTTVSDIQANREKSVQAIQEAYGGVVILKGAHTLIAAPNQPIIRCLAGNPGMSSAGMGDLLSGIIAGLIARGLTIFEAAQAGVFLHATAADRLLLRQGEYGLLASDVCDVLPQVMLMLTNNGQS